MIKINQISILMHLLSSQKKIDEIGAKESEILNALNMKNKNGSILLQDLIINLSRYLEPLELLVKFNPLNNHWFLMFNSEISDFISANPFQNKQKLAATLFCVLTCCLKNKGVASIQEVNKIRNKKDLLDDLKELEKKGYIIIDKISGNITLTPLIGYQLDLQKLFLNLNVKLKEKITPIQ